MLEFTIKPSLTNGALNKMKAWQKIIFLNYGLVKPENIAEIIGAKPETVIELAGKMGLEKIKYNPRWLKDGYITILRNNWNLLSRKQLCILLEFEEKELELLLRDCDFLGEKLGDQLLPESVSYTAPDDGDIEFMEAARRFVENNYIEPSVNPFDFYAYPAKRVELPDEQAIFSRFVSAYCAKYSGALLDDELSDYNEEYLLRLRNTGTTGIWLHESLRNLAEFPFDTSLSPDYKARIANLKKLTERCLAYGIDVYLYLNEPRSLPPEFFDKYPQLKGQLADDGEICLCTSNPEVLKYLYDSVRYIAENVPLLKGIMTITMSENPTHCHSKKWAGGRTDCPRCKGRAPEEITSEINNIMAKALKDGNGYTRLIANLWGWSSFMLWSEEQTLRGVSLLDKDVDILCVSEYSKKFQRGGVDVELVDYSISVTGPSDLSKRTLEYAKSLGHNIFAKVQINNSWECSAVPYMPTFSLMARHINNLKDIGVSGLMMSWSLGGFPGGAMPYCNALCACREFDEGKWYRDTYGESADTVMAAEKIFSSAFEKFPFSVDSLYFGGQTLGVGNDIITDHSNRESSMVCFTYDDYEKYTAPYGIDIYTRLYTSLCDEWERGLSLLEGLCGNQEFESFKNVSLGAYIHFKSALMSALAAKHKRRGDTARLLECAVTQLDLTRKMYALISRDATIGFEMTNHYYYNSNLLLLRMLELSNFIQNHQKSK